MTDSLPLVIPLRLLSLSALETPLELYRGCIRRVESYHSIRARFHPGAQYAVEIEAYPNERFRRTMDRVLTVFKLFKDAHVLADGERMLAANLQVAPHWFSPFRGCPV